MIIQLMISDILLKALHRQLRSLQENLHLHFNRLMESKLLVLVALKESLKPHTTEKLNRQNE